MGKTKWYWAAITLDGFLQYGWTRDYRATLAKMKDTAVFDMGFVERSVMENIPKLWETYDTLKKLQGAQMNTHCKWCLCELEKYARPGGECANCWEIRRRCQRNPEVGLLIAVTIGRKYLLKLLREDANELGKPGTSNKQDP